MKLDQADLRYRRRGIVKDDTEDTLVLEKEIAALEAEIRACLLRPKNWLSVLRVPELFSNSILKSKLTAGSHQPK